jgi:hypothetical protein
MGDADYRSIIVARAGRGSAIELPRPARGQSRR